MFSEALGSFASLEIREVIISQPKIKIPHDKRNGRGFPAAIFISYAIVFSGLPAIPYLLVSGA